MLDVNVVLAAHRGDHPHHDVKRPWFDAAVRGADGFCVPLTVCASFLRLSTSRRIFTVPTTVAEAFDFLGATREQPGHLPLEPGPRHPSDTCDRPEPGSRWRPSRAGPPAGWS